MTEQFAYPIKVPKDRHEKRLMRMEGYKINKCIGGVEIDFYNDLFDDNNTLSYMELYNSHKMFFSERVELLSGRVKFFKINEKYFANQYKPE